jgi:hypothetical protein
VSNCHPASSWPLIQQLQQSSKRQRVAADTCVCLVLLVIPGPQWYPACLLMRQCGGIEPIKPCGPEHQLAEIENCITVWHLLPPPALDAIVAISLKKHHLPHCTQLPLLTPLLRLAPCDFGTAFRLLQLEAGCNVGLSYRPATRRHASRLMTAENLDRRLCQVETAVTQLQRAVRRQTVRFYLY